MHDPSIIQHESFACSLDHVLAELARVDILIRERVDCLRAGPDDPYRGLYISEADVDGLLQSLAQWSETRAPTTDEALHRLEEAIAGRLAATGDRLESLRLYRLQQLFGLNARDHAVVLLCLAPEVSLKYERLFAYLQDDVTKRRPTVELALDLVCASFAERVATRARLDPDAPLVRCDLIECFDDSAAVRPSMPAKCLRLDDRIARYLLGSDAIDERLRGVAQRIAVTDLRQAPRHARDLSQFAQRAAALVRGGSRALLRLSGRDHALRRRWAEAFCARARMDLLVVDCVALAAQGAEATKLARLAMREARLLSAAIYWDDADLLPGSAKVCAVDDDNPESRVVFVACSSRAAVANFATNHAPPPISVVPPTTAERTCLWRDALGRRDARRFADDIPGLASTFRFSADDIQGAVQAARVRARWRDGGSLATADLYASCRERSSPRLETLARKTPARRNWSDLVLPDDPQRQLREICDHIRFRAQVLEEYGFEAKLPGGRGLSILFSGPSGVGKTMAAEVMANELGLDLYRIDLSAVVSKYIGETEKNLSRVFDEAEDTSAILLFDEADALFGKRSEVQDAHDRHANVETSFLLQRMETYEGVSILATNLRRNMDEAFTRRIAHIVQFPAPETAERLRLWHGAFPVRTPRASDIDFDFLAKSFSLTGANIKAAAVAAAALAAREGAAVSMRHLVHATRRELQKQGKMVANSDFGTFAHLLSDG